MALHVPISARAEARRRGTPVPDERLEELLEDSAFLQRYCERILKDPHAAEDLVQETYLQALRHLDRIDRRGSFAPWLATVARTRSINEIRRRSRLSPVEEVPDQHDRSQPDPHEYVESTEAVDAAIEALERLTPRERRLLELQVRDGLSMAELAVEDDSTTASVKSVLNRARAKLRGAFESAELWVLAPVGAVLGSLRRHLHSAGARVQQVSPALPGGFERIGEAVTAVVATLALGASVAPAVGGGSGRGPLPATAAQQTPGAAGSGVPGTSASAGGVGPGGEVPGGATGSHVGAARAMREPGPAGSGPGGAPESGPSVPGVPPVTPTPTPPPVTQDDVDEPEDASFNQFVWTGQGAASSQSDRGEVFALGEVSGRCTADCTVLFRSPDAGATWEKVPAEGIGDADQLLVAPGYPGDPRMYAMTPSGLVLSTDGGRSFAALPTEPHAGPAAMSPGFSAGDERILIGGTPSWVYDAATDTTRPFAMPGLTGVAHRFAFGTTPDVLYVGALAQGANGLRRPTVFRCTTESCEPAARLAGLASPTLWPAVGDRIFATTGDALLASGDGASSFVVADLPREGIVQSLADDAAGAVYVGLGAMSNEATAGGLIALGGETSAWEATSLTKPMAAVETLNTGRVIAAPERASGGGLFCSPDAGSSWTPRCPES